MLHYRALLLAALMATPGLAQTASYYLEPGSYGTARESEPPSYVRNLGQQGYADLAWLDAGLDYRLRAEFRDDDIRRLQSVGLDDPLLLRTRAYLGIREVLDPLRVALEFEDARRHRSAFPKDERDVNEMELIQAHAELYYPAAFGEDPRGNLRPLSIRVGRMAFEVLDRRLIARNEWRNTTNNFDGVRVSLGQQSSDWQLELMALRPVTRQLSSLDRPNQDQRLSAVVGHVRLWSDRVTLEPHYLRLQQQASLATSQRKRDIHGGGLRIYGNAKDGRLNYDISTMLQWGRDGSQDHDAHSFLAEIGYIYSDHPWRPRLSAFYGYASGDRNALDTDSERFERYFGFARPWSANDYIAFENISTPKLRLELQPVAGVRIDTGYSAYWLASATDRYSTLLGGSAFNRDASGQSGDFIGHEVDARLRFSLNDHLDANIGYAHFRAGRFGRNRQQAALGDSGQDTDFFYLELTLGLF